MNWLALDIGGANIKAADGKGYAESYAFAMWRQSSRLAQQIRTVISEAPACDHLAVTMTGELADCFESKAAGVRFILQAVGDGSDNRHTRIFLVDGRLVSPQVALGAPHLAAASNWLALARFVGRYVPHGPALLIDVGSTTCDVVPFVDGKPQVKGMNDTARLLASELVYTGVERSPLCAILHDAPYRGRSCPLVQELFATTRDAYLLLGQLPEEPGDTQTADGKPATRAFARARLARMFAADLADFSDEDAVALAQAAAEAQSALLATAIERIGRALAGPPQKVVLSGHGEFLARQALEKLQAHVPVVSLAAELGQVVSRSAPAHALAVLAREMTSA